jgi:nucleoside-triphosphatase
MPPAVFVTGPPGSGKTTAVLRTVEELRCRGFKVGGMLSREVRRGQSRWGFEVVDLESGAVGVLASVEQPTGPRVGKYRVNLRDLEGVGVKAIERAVEGCDVVVIDEVGPMELASQRFKEAVRRALDSGKVVVGTVHLKAREGLIGEVKRRRDVKLITLTYEGRELLSRSVVEEAVRLAEGALRP